MKVTIDLPQELHKAVANLTNEQRRGFLKEFSQITVIIVKAMMEHKIAVIQAGLQRQIYVDLHMENCEKAKDMMFKDCCSEAFQKEKLEQASNNEKN